MGLKKVKIEDFRSYDSAEFEFGPGLNLVIGPNGAGKTNLLEAVYVLANTRSWREPDRHLVRTAAAGYKIRGETETKSLQIEYSLAGKGLIVNSTKTLVRQYLGWLRTVLFEPGSLAIVGGGPEDRRAWLDQALSAHSPEYLLALLRYRRILRQRNRLLKYDRSVDVKEQVFAWDINLTQQAEVLVAQRVAFTEFINQKLDGIYKKLSGKAASITVSYLQKPVPQVGADGYGSHLLQQLTNSIDTDLRFGFTTVGPHRDDVAIKIKGLPASRVASRGEARSIVLAAKLTELEWMKKRPQAPVPVMLFDDVFSELDERRRRACLELLGDTQVILSATDARGLSSRLKKATVLKL